MIGGDIPATSLETVVSCLKLLTCLVGQGSLK